ncbi:MAG: site-specific integrase [Planctomycetes bacterium]|nr:site-specific integrase [Planctomycetota bacterium]
MLSLAESWGYRPDASNPCRHINRFAESKRERFLSEDELGRLGAVLARAEREGTETKAAIAAIRLLAVTGCRRGEILTLEWAHVDFGNGCLRLAEGKTGAKIVYLAPAALEILEDIERQDGNPYVIVGREPGAHLVNLSAPWARLRKLAGLDGVRIHDLRHGFAAIGAAGGFVSAASNEGIYPGMWSGQIAADVLITALKGRQSQDELMAFDAAWRMQMADYLRSPNTDHQFLLPLIFSNQPMADRMGAAIFSGENI